MHAEFGKVTSEIPAIPEDFECIKEAIRIRDEATEDITKDIPEWELTIPVIETQDGNGILSKTGKIIKDAIPVSDK